jgi:hypothetical protein
MKKLMANSLGIVSVMTILIMAVVRIGWSVKSIDSRPDRQYNQSDDIKGSKNTLSSMCEQIDRLSDKVKDIRPQNTYINCEADNSGRNNRRRFDESLFEDSYAYDPTDYPNEDSFVRIRNNDHNFNRNEDEKKAKPADIIE